MPGAAPAEAVPDEVATLNRRLRIAMVHYSDFIVDSRIQREAHALTDRGHEVHCLCVTDPDRIPTAGTDPVRLYSVGSRSRRDGAADYLMGYGRFFAAALRGLNALQRLHPLDVVVAHNMPNFLALSAVVPKLRGARVVLDMHDTFPELFQTKFGFAAGSLASRAVHLEERVSVAFADRTIAVTEEARRRIAARCPRGRVEWVVMNTPDERIFGPPRGPVTLPVDGPLRVVYHGGTARRFGVDELIRAFEHINQTVSEVCLDVYGSDGANDELVELAHGVAADRVRVSPKPVPFARIPNEIAGAHIGVVPTLQDPFTELLLPVKLMEYIHLGIPVISSRLPVIERYFGDDEILFVAPGDPAAITGAIEEVRRDPAQARERARRAGSRLREFDWRDQGMDYVHRIEALAAERVVL